MMKAKKHDSFAVASEAYEKKHYKKAFKLFLESATSGDEDSMLMLGVMYGSGRGVEIDFKKSIEWSERAIAAGSISAIINVGITYRTIGDSEKARQWFEKSLEAGDVEAALHLAKIYMVSKLELERVIGYLNIVVNSKNVLEMTKFEAMSLLEHLLE